MTWKTVVGEDNSTVLSDECIRRLLSLLAFHLKHRVGWRGGMVDRDSGSGPGSSISVLALLV